MYKIMRSLVWDKLRLRLGLKDTGLPGILTLSENVVVVLDGDELQGEVHAQEANFNLQTGEGKFTVPDDELWYVVAAYRGVTTGVSQIKVRGQSIDVELNDQVTGRQQLNFGWRQMPLLPKESMILLQTSNVADTAIYFGIRYRRLKLG